MKQSAPRPRRRASRTISKAFRKTISNAGWGAGNHLVRRPEAKDLRLPAPSFATRESWFWMTHCRASIPRRKTRFLIICVRSCRGGRRYLFRIAFPPSAHADRMPCCMVGRIVELGTHDELIARNGYYMDLYNKQLLEEELAEVLNS